MTVLASSQLPTSIHWPTAIVLSMWPPYVSTY